MLAKAEVKYIRLSARKTRLVIDLIKGKTVEEANFILDSVNKGACQPLKKILGSAFANLNQNGQDQMLSKDVIISKIKADGGPTLERYRAATMGRATPIRHRTAHLYVELDKAVEKISKKRKNKSRSK